MDLSIPLRNKTSLQAIVYEGIFRLPDQMAAMPKSPPPARPHGSCASPPASRPEPTPPAPRLFGLLHKIDAASSSSLPPPGRTCPRGEAVEADLSKWTLPDPPIDPSTRGPLQKVRATSQATKGPLGANLARTFASHANGSESSRHRATTFLPRTHCDSLARTWVRTIYTCTPIHICS